MKIAELMANKLEKLFQEASLPVDAEVSDPVETSLEPEANVA